ncbi:MAG: hypothetical protein M3022_01175 [Actinomycetota bacterium]|nr:hypothetical protein [Actinomycetota bacterium]
MGDTRDRAARINTGSRADLAAKGSGVHIVAAAVGRAPELQRTLPIRDDATFPRVQPSRHEIRAVNYHRLAAQQQPVARERSFERQRLVP